MVEEVKQGYNNVTDGEMAGAFSLEHHKRPNRWMAKQMDRWMDGRNIKTFWFSVIRVNLMLFRWDQIYSEC